MSADSVDHQLTDPAWFATNDPHTIWRGLRMEDPVHWTKGKLPFGFWSLTRYEDMLTVLRDPVTFSSERGEGNVLPTSSEINTIDRQTAGFGEMLVSTDPPRHGPVRRAFTKVFLRSSIKRFERQGRLLAREIVDEVAPLGTCDLVDDVAVKMPMRFICALMGIPREDWDRMLLLGNMSANPEEPEYQQGRTPQETRLSAFRELYDYCLRLAQDRRSNPGEDLLSLVGMGIVEGKPLSDRVIGYNGILLIGAGFETTRNALSGGLLELIKNPSESDRLRYQPSLIRTAVEEILRWTSPLTNAMRMVARNTEIRGQRIRPGERVVIWLPSGNRDEEIFADADQFDVGRTPNDHVAFGYGEHFCLGAHLARLEIRVLLDEILNRLPGIRLDGEVERICSNQLAGIKHMPIRFTPMSSQ
jgi:cholest-4-en-3-one 26-monooxygenase